MTTFVAILAALVSNLRARWATWRTRDHCQTVTEHKRRAWR